MKSFKYIPKLFAILAEWVALKVSRVDQIDGVVVCDLTPSQPFKDVFVDRTRQAMALIKELDLRRYHRVCRDIHYIANTALLSRGQYGRELRICRVDHERGFNSPQPQVNVRQYAATLIHEATHGLLFRKGIPYDEKTRERVERLCHLEACRFASRLGPEYADLFPSPYNPKWHKQSWEGPTTSKRRAILERARQAWRLSFPKSSSDYQQLGRAHTRKGQYDEAIAACDKAIQLNPSSPAAFLSRATAYMKKKDYQKAILDYDHGIQLNPKDPLAYINRGTAHFQCGDYDRAIADADQALSLNPQSAIAFINRAGAHLMKRDYNRAIADCDCAIQINPKEAASYVNRGYALNAIGVYDKAAADYEKALQLDPRSDSAHKNLAWLLATCPENDFRDAEKAVEHAMKACLLSEWKSPGAVSTLAAASAAAGDFVNAVKWQSQYLGMPDLTSAAKASGQKTLALYEVQQPYHADKPTIKDAAHRYANDLNKEIAP